MQIDEWTGIELSEQVLQEAAQWIAELDNITNNTKRSDRDLQSIQEIETYNTSRQFAFYEWLGEDPSHQQAYAELSEMWAKTACMKSMSAAINTPQVIEFPKQSAQISDISLFPHAKAKKQSTGTRKHANVWAYSASMALILLGLLVPAFQSIF